MCVCVTSGYEQFGPMRSDPALCFKAMCGEELPGPKKKKAKKNPGKVVVGGAKGDDFDSDGSDSGEDSDIAGVDSGPATPLTPSSKAMLGNKR